MSSEAEIRRVLASAARELATATWCELRGWTTANSDFGVQIETREEAFNRVLERTLLPLLLSGQAMRGRLDYVQKIPANIRAKEAWDAALAVAAKEQGGKSAT